jgi:large subunit ribosomal protein L17
MRHRHSGRKFGMDPTARKAMLRNMVTSLMIHGQIRTTQARAKELRGYAEKVVSLAKRAPSTEAIASMKGKTEKEAASAARVHAIRRVRRWVNNDGAIEKLFGEYAERFANRPGGYTRVVKAGVRPGDNADMAVIQLVEALDIGGAKKAKPAKAEAAPVEAPVEAKEEAAAEVADAEGAAEE